MQLFKNNTYSTLGASLTNVATTLTVATGQGDRFPVVTAPDFALVTLQDAANNIEIVKVTARAAGADSMTIVRAQEGTTARAWAIGDVVELRLTAASLAPLGVLEGDATAADIRTTLDVPTRTGGDASGTWGISITGSAATAGACSGNSATATKLATPRTINGSNFDGSAAITTINWGAYRAITIGATGKSVNGSTNVTWTLAEIGAAAANATVNLTGDQTVAGVKTFSDAVVANGVAAFTNAGWYKSVQMRTAGGVFWAKGASTRAKAIVSSGDDNIYFVASTADDNSAAATYPFTFDMAGGNFTATGNVTAYSDERLKTDWDVGALWSDGLVQNLAYIKAGTYTRTDTGERQIGVSAQSLRTVMPEAVLEGKDGMLSVAYGNAALVACVALAREVVQLRQRVEQLEAR